MLPRTSAESRVPVFAFLTLQGSTVPVERVHCLELFPRHHTFKCPLVSTSVPSGWFCSLFVSLVVKPWLA